MKPIRINRYEICKALNITNPVPILEMVRRNCDSTYISILRPFTCHGKPTTYYAQIAHYNLTQAIEVLTDKLRTKSTHAQAPRWRQSIETINKLIKYKEKHE